MDVGRQYAHRYGRAGTASARTCHGLLALIVATSFGIQLVLLFSGDGYPPSVSIGTRLVRLFSYFTIESNLLVLIASTTLAVDPERDGRLWRVLRLDALLGIVITGVVFATVLARQVHLTGAAEVANIGFHYVSPWAALLAWIVYGPRPRVTWHAAMLAFVWPILWIGYTFAHGAATSWYPYPFLDVSVKGYPSALLSTLAVLVLGVVLAVAFRLLDRVRVPGAAPAQAQRLTQRR